MKESLLPEAFVDLEPFAPIWCLASEAERWEQRMVSSMAELRAFYEAAAPRFEEALAHCDGLEFTALPADARRLFELLQSFLLVSFAIEVWQQPDVLHRGTARIDRIREPGL